MALWGIYQNSFSARKDCWPYGASIKIHLVLESIFDLTGYLWKVCFMMMMNYFCKVVDQQKASNLFSSQNHCQSFLPSQISDMHEQDLSLSRTWVQPGFVKGSCVISDNDYTVTPPVILTNTTDWLERVWLKYRLSLYLLTILQRFLLCDVSVLVKFHSNSTVPTILGKIFGKK